MKKITYIVISLLLMVSYSYGQGEIEGNNFSRSDLYGTARAVSMGGAFGALGGDLTGVSINPAGIAVYRSSEIATTAVFQNEKFKAGDISKDKNSFKLHNLGFVGYFPTRNEVIPVVNFGFSYNKIKSFDREISAYGANRGSSLTDYMAHISREAYGGIGVDATDMGFGSDPWLTVLGFDSYLINDFPYNIDGEPNLTGYDYESLLSEGEKVNNSLYLSERGSIDVYDFTVGTSINNVFNVGISLSVTDMYYDIYSENKEDLPLGNSSFNLTNILESEGSGVGVKVGVIYRPTNELRLGLAYHSPTWYNMTDIYAAGISHNVASYVSDDELANYESGRVDSRDDDRGYFAHDYKFKTPDKWTASAALVLGRNMIISADYELTNYGSMKYSEASGYNVRREDSYDENANVFIKDDFKASSTIRTGLEYRFTPQFSGRLGYAWMQNPYESAFKDQGNAVTVGSTTAYRIEGDANYITGGFGYRFNRNFYADLAVVYKTQKDDLYSYSNVYYDTGEKFIDAAPYKLTNNSIRGLLTIGYKF